MAKIWQERIRYGMRKHLGHWKGLHGGTEFLNDLFLIHRVRWDQIEEENWAGRIFFRGP